MSLRNEAFFALGDPSNRELVNDVLYVEEVEFGTGNYFWYDHNAFRVTMSSGERWVFDPTGVQFGPDWPLFARWEGYIAQRRRGHLCVTNLGTQESTRN